MWPIRGIVAHGFSCLCDLDVFICSHARYAQYLYKEKKVGPDVRKGLELTKGVLKSGRVSDSYLYDDARPSAPLRAFSYTQAGGMQSCGERSSINAVFKCPGQPSLLIVW